MGLTSDDTLSALSPGDRLGPYEIVRQKIEAAVAAGKDYKPNKHKVDDALKARIRERWKTYFDRYGYF